MLHLILWFVLLQIIGAAGFAWAFLFFRDLPDRGYGVSKVLGLLLLAYAYWALVTARVLDNGLPWLLTVLVLLLGASAVLVRQWRGEMLEFVRSRWRLIVANEVVFLLAFVAFAAFRVFVPDITVSTAITGLTTEQPMDLAFLASSLRSPTFPAADPWLAGHPINYYYFGYLIFSIPARLSGATAAVGYNLAIITVFALTAVSAFSLTMNAVLRSGMVRVHAPKLDAAAVIGGVAAVAALLIAGNLSGGIHALTEMLSLSGATGFSFWWWESTRIITDPGALSPIDEFPAFSFLLGDLHPHLMSLPFVLLALSVMLAWLYKPLAPDVTWPKLWAGELFLTALIIGALGFINTWDFLAYMAVLTMVILVRRLWDRGHGEDGSRMRTMMDALVPAMAITLLAVGLFIPYYLTLSGSVKGVLPVAETGTELSHYARIWGPMALAILPPAVYAWLRIRGGDVRPIVLSSIMLIVAAPLILWTVVVSGWNLLPEDVSLPVDAPTLVGMGWRWIIVAPALALAAVGVAAAIPLRNSNNLERQGLVFAVLLLVAAAMGIVIAELFFAWDSFGARMNTVFKVHFQVWALLSVATGVGVAWVITQRPQRFFPAGIVLAIVGAAGLGLLIAGVVYTPAGIAERVASSPSRSIELDGLATYRTLYPDDAAAIDWLQGNAERDDHVLEAFGDDYTDHGRVSAITGLPTVIGWQGHELQWRGGAELFAGRPADVGRIYRGYDETDGRVVSGTEIRRTMEFYEVDYVFVGSLENRKYGLGTADMLLSTLPLRLRKAFASGDTVVLEFVE